MAPGPAAPENCVFCEIAAGRAPAYKVYEDDQTVAFLDLFPITRGHLLVIPRRHGARLTDFGPEDQAALVRTLEKMCRRAERLTSDYNVGMNAGARAGQIVFHLHFHLIPRYDAGNPFQPSRRTRLTDEQAEAVVAELSAA